MVKIVNIIGSGSLNTEIELSQLAGDIGSQAKYDPDKYLAYTFDSTKKHR